MKSKWMIVPALLAVFGLLFIGCGGGTTPEVPDDDVIVDVVDTLGTEGTGGDKEYSIKLLDNFEYADTYQYKMPFADMFNFDVTIGQEYELDIEFNISRDFEADLTWQFINDNVAASPHSYWTHLSTLNIIGAGEAGTTPDWFEYDKYDPNPEKEDPVSPPAGSLGYDKADGPFTYKGNLTITRGASNANTKLVFETKGAGTTGKKGGGTKGEPTITFTKFVITKKAAAADLFIAVSGITLSSHTYFSENSPYTLSGTVTPSEATNKTIVWSKKEGTGFDVADGKLTIDESLASDTTGKITATITNGATKTTDFTKDFDITIKVGAPDGMTITLGSTKTDVEVTASKKVSFEYTADFDGYVLTSGEGDYQDNYVWFSLDLGSKMLYDTYESITFTYDPGKGDTTYKPFTLWATDTEFTGDRVSPEPSVGELTGNAVEGSKVTRTILIDSDSSKTLTGKIYMAIYVPGAKTGAGYGTPPNNPEGNQYTITDIKLNAVKDFYPVTAVDIHKHTFGLDEDPATLSADVEPARATNKAIVWSIVAGSAVDTDATITTSPTLTFSAGGTVNVIATIANGTAQGTDFVSAPIKITILEEDLDPIAFTFGTSAGQTAVLTTNATSLTVAYTSDNKGFTVTKTSEWHNELAYFKVTFPEGLSLSNYSELAFTYTGVSGDFGSKDVVLGVSATAFTGNWSENPTEAPYTASSVWKSGGGEDAVGGKPGTVTITGSQASAADNSLYFTIFINAEAASYTFSNVVLNP